MDFHPIASEYGSTDFNQPVNESLPGWMPTTLPADWSDYRLRSEIGHARIALVAVIAFVALIR